MWIIGLIIAIVVVVIVLIIIGGTSPSPSSGGTVSGGNPFAGCVDCRTLNSYWSGLSALGKTKMAAWYTAKQAHCFLAC
jgi:hypothetical protein